MSEKINFIDEQRSFHKLFKFIDRASNILVTMKYVPLRTVCALVYACLHVQCDTLEGDISDMAPLHLASGVGIDFTAYTYVSVPLLHTPLIDNLRQRTCLDSGMVQQQFRVLRRSLYVHHSRMGKEYLHSTTVERRHNYVYLKISFIVFGSSIRPKHVNGTEKMN